MAFSVASLPTVLTNRLPLRTATVEMDLERVFPLAHLMVCHSRLDLLLRSFILMALALSSDGEVEACRSRYCSLCHCEFCSSWKYLSLALVTSHLTWSRVTYIGQGRPQLRAFRLMVRFFTPPRVQARSTRFHRESRRPASDTFGE